MQCLRPPLFALFFPSTCSHRWLLLFRRVAPNPPAPQTIDRVHFIINNITSMNIEQKAKELKGIVAQEYWPWFANYLVVKRAAQVRPVPGAQRRVRSRVQPPTQLPPRHPSPLALCCMPSTA